MITLPPAKRRFGNIHLDLVGPLPVSEGYRYLLTFIDRFTRWPVAVPLQDITSQTVCRAFLRSWLPLYGVPDEITSDRGAQFSSGAWRDLMKSLGIKFHMTTAYHPQANGLVERWHRQLKASLKARLDGDDSWMDALPFVMLGLRSTWREDSDTTPADLVFGTALCLPGQFVPNSGDGSAEVTDTFVKTLRDRMSSLSPVTQPHHSTPTSHVPSSLLSAEWVYMRHDAVRRPLQCPYDGPYKVITPGEKTFICLLYTSPSPRD